MEPPGLTSRFCILNLGVVFFGLVPVGVVVLLLLPENDFKRFGMMRTMVSVYMQPLLVTVTMLDPWISPFKSRLDPTLDNLGLGGQTTNTIVAVLPKRHKEPDDCHTLYAPAPTHPIVAVNIFVCRLQVLVYSPGPQWSFQEYSSLPGGGICSFRDREVDCLNGDW
jgi:hypothetical protein